MTKNLVSKVALLNDWFAPEIVGGVEKSVSEIACSLRESGCLVRVFTLNQPALSGLHKINNTEVDFTWGLNIRKRNTSSIIVHVLEKLRILVDVVTPIVILTKAKRYRPNYLIFHEIDRFGPWLLLFARLFFDKNQLMRVHHDLSDTCILRSRARGYNVCDKLCMQCLPKSNLYAKLNNLVSINISNSNFIANELQSLGFKTNISNVGNPVLISETQKILIPFQDVKRSVGFVGRITKLKGIETIFRAASFLEPKWEVHMIGPVKENYKLHLLALAEQLKISAKFYDPVPNPYQEISELVDCVIVASESFEAFGKVPLEASMAGIPVISTEIGGLKESLDYISPRPGVFPVQDPLALAQLLSEFRRPKELIIKPTNENTLTSIIKERLGLVR